MNLTVREFDAIKEVKEYSGIAIAKISKAKTSTYLHFSYVYLHFGQVDCGFFKKNSIEIQSWKIHNPSNITLNIRKTYIYAKMYFTFYGFIL